MANVIAHIRPFAFFIEVNRKLGGRRNTGHKFLGIYDIPFKEFKKVHKNDWSEDSIQDYSERNIDTQNWLIDNTPECGIYFQKLNRNDVINDLLND